MANHIGGSGGHKFTDLEREDVLAKVAELEAQHLPFQEIADIIGVNRQQIYAYRQMLTERWRESQLVDTDYYHRLELQKMDAIEAHLWKAWATSREDRITKTESDAGYSITTQEHPAGDPRFLLGVLHCMERRAKLLGLDAATKLDEALQNMLDSQVDAIAKEYGIDKDTIITEAREVFSKARKELKSG